MRKNRMCRLASVLLIMVLLTTSIVGSTFAKYTTSDTVSDNARVAKWGVVVATEGKAFETQYDTDDESVKGTFAQSVVTSTDNMKLVAPGTDGGLVKGTVTGTPEVAVEVSASGTLTLSNWTIPTDGGGTEEYCPIIITIDNVEYKMGTTASSSDTEKVFTTIADLTSAVNTALTKKESFAPKSVLGTAFNPDVSWKWNIADNATGAYQDNDKDTALGDAAAAATADKIPTITLAYTVTVTQID